MYKAWPIDYIVAATESSNKIRYWKEAKDIEVSFPNVGHIMSTPIDQVHK